jgi:hypothetical protein
LHSTGAAIDFGVDVAVIRDAAGSVGRVTLGAEALEAGIDL